MRCKKHPTDLSSAAGVCASCLRERLLQLIDEQARADEALALARQLAHSHSRSSDDRRRPEPQPPQPAFPRSVSPYVSRRKSDNYHRRFYSTPQVGPTFSATCSFLPSEKKQSKLSRFVNLFRSRSDKINSDPSVCSNSDPRISPHRDSCQASSSSSYSASWLSFLPRRRRKQQANGDITSSQAGRRPCRISNRGMSPERGFELDDHLESGYSSESSQQGWRRTPVMAVTPASVRRKRAGRTKSASSMAFCLSPLVRASPSRQWNQKGVGLQSESGVSGEIRVPGKPYLSTTASCSGNRSRKLTDFGRVAYNR
ncbi:uncharacterized protein LOC116202279 [Punica granatum]|uniref:Uncharacterized protein n=2 Tax=Punica granatum TaxID=22663 RepID=A0A218XG02_PUNGR|nr:uncharacterized protein LOC116202279 [Punica granatum]OWM83680.1 hypothetical protein CDL15_Pgr004110 [Punica granatum]PKI35395.1 hypothetical protein CRG98_044214 [Punica granatum]